MKDREAGVCRSKNPLLYSFAAFLVGAYWVGVFFGIVGLLQTFFGEEISSRAQESLEKVICRWNRTYSLNFDAPETQNMLPVLRLSGRRVALVMRRPS